MDFYKDENGVIFDGQSDISPKWIKLTPEEVEDIFNPKKPIEQLKSEKLAEIKQCFKEQQEFGFCESSIGFNVDSTMRSKMNIESLMNIGLYPVKFRCCDNQSHELTKDELSTILREVNEFNIGLYHKKWELEELVKQAETIEELESIKWI